MSKDTQETARAKVYPIDVRENTERRRRQEEMHRVHALADRIAVQLTTITQPDDRLAREAYDLAEAVIAEGRRREREASDGN